MNNLRVRFWKRLRQKRQLITSVRKIQVCTKTAYHKHKKDSCVHKDSLSKNIRKNQSCTKTAYQNHKIQSCTKTAFHKHKKNSVINFLVYTSKRPNAHYAWRFGKASLPLLEHFKTYKALSVATILTNSWWGWVLLLLQDGNTEADVN